MDFIFMLTRGDKTIEDCLDVMDQIAPLGLTHIGFKDVGVEYATLEKLTAKIKAIGATSYMEVVSETPEACLRSAEIGRRLGIDRLLGGTDVAAVQKIIAGTKTEYYPFSGFPKGHPTRLGGRPADVEAHCAAFTQAGCAGTDLLAYRATEADPLDLVRAAHEIQDRAGALMAAAVQQAREAGRTWQEIGDVLGVSRQAVFQRYGKPIDPRTGEVMNTTPLLEAADLARAVIDDHAHTRWADVTARFDATMRDGLTEEGLAEAWAYIVGLAGAYEGHGETDVMRAGDFTITNTPLNFEAGDFVARITFRDDRTIAGLFILNPDAAGGAGGSNAN